MYEKDKIRIASSELVSALFGNISRYKTLLSEEKKRLHRLYSYKNLDFMFDNLDTRIINICPMVLCNSLLDDLSIDCPNDLLAGIGLAMFSISTHDDLVDEMPVDRSVIAGLVYSGNIATLEGIKSLFCQGYDDVARIVIDYINLNHYYQTKIVDTLWARPTNEKEYLEAISHTKYWAAIGLKAAVTFAGKEDLQTFADDFAECYGTCCQLFDDMREIKDDIRNKYYSLAISLANYNGLDLTRADHLNLAIERPRELAKQYLERAKMICGDSYPNLLGLVKRIEKAGLSIYYK